tara:strand:+ start:448 stop:774 length:327 start_codon:yes stop_codon:yes gene_type:complete
MKLTVEAKKIIEEGKHEGIIVEILQRNTPYRYTDFVIEFNQGSKLKYGLPTTLFQDSKLGLFLEQFGLKLEVGQEIELDQLIGRGVTFMTMNDGKFANIVGGSVKPNE